MGKFWWFIALMYSLFLVSVLFVDVLPVYMVMALLVPLVVPIATVIFVIVLYRLKNPACLMIIITSPLVFLPVVNIARASLEYLAGTAVARHVVLGEDGGGICVDRIDRTLRCRVVNTFDSIFPLHLVCGWPYNLTLSAMTHTFGVMRGAYRGLLPEMDVASVRLTNSGGPVTREQLISGGFLLGGQRVQIKPQLARALLSACKVTAGTGWTQYCWEAPAGDLEMVMITPECLLVRARSKEGAAYIAIVDLGHQRVVMRERDPLDEYRSTGPG